MNKETQKELDALVDKIRRYPKGFEFTVNYASVPTQPKLNALNWVLNKAKKLGYIESIAIGHSLEDITGESGRFCSEETFVRI